MSLRKLNKIFYLMTFAWILEGIKTWAELKLWKCPLNEKFQLFHMNFQNFPHGAKHLHSLILRCCNISDRGLQALMEFLQGLYKLEIAGCNEITEQGLWSSLHPRLVKH